MIVIYNVERVYIHFFSINCNKKFNRIIDQNIELYQKIKQNISNLFTLDSMALKYA